MFCPKCGTQNDDNNYRCTKCGQIIQNVPQASVTDDPAMKYLLPIGRSPLAIAAGYAGLFALIPCLAPVALVLGILAYRDLQKHPEQGGMGRAIFGLVMGALGTLALLAFLLFSVVAHR